MKFFIGLLVCIAASQTVSAQDLLGSLGLGRARGLQAGLPPVTDAASPITNAAEPVLDAAQPRIAPALGAASGVMALLSALPPPVLQQLFDALLAVIGQILNSLQLDTVTGALAPLLDTATGVVAPVVDSVTGVAGPVIGATTATVPV